MNEMISNYLPLFSSSPPLDVSVPFPILSPSYCSSSPSLHNSYSYYPWPLTFCAAEVFSPPPRRAVVYPSDLDPDNGIRAGSDLFSRSEGSESFSYNLKPDLPNFTGKEDVHWWLRRVEQLMDFYSFDEGLRVSMAALYLEGVPLEWYRGNMRAKGKPLSWAEFTKGLASLCDNSKTYKVFDEIPQPAALLIRHLFDKTPQSIMPVSSTPSPKRVASQSILTVDVLATKVEVAAHAEVNEETAIRKEIVVVSASRGKTLKDDKLVDEGDRLMRVEEKNKEEGLNAGPQSTRVPLPAQNYLSKLDDPHCLPGVRQNFRTRVDTLPSFFCVTESCSLSARQGAPTKLKLEQHTTGPLATSTSTPVRMVSSSSSNLPKPSLLFADQRLCSAAIIPSQVQPRIKVVVHKFLKSLASSTLIISHLPLISKTSTMARLILQVVATEEVAPPLQVVQMEGLAISEIIKHCMGFSAVLDTGQLLCLDVGSVLEVKNCFPFLNREEDEEIEANGANDQLELMRCLRKVNVDNNTIGWYQTVEPMETYMNYQGNIQHCVCIIYDLARSNQEVLALKALKLSDSFMALYRKNNFTGEKLMENRLPWTDIFEEMPIKVSNYALISSFMFELEPDSPILQCDYDCLKLSTTPFIEKNVEFVILAPGRNDQVDFVMEVVPLFTNHLHYYDAKVLDHAFVCLTRIADAFSSSPEKLHELCNHGLVAQTVEDAIMPLGMPNMDSVTGNAMISTRRQLGHGNYPIKLFDDMIKEGICSDQISSLMVLTAYNHALEPFKLLGFLVVLFCIFQTCVGFILPSLARLRVLYVSNELRIGMISLSLAPARVAMAGMYLSLAAWIVRNDIAGDVGNVGRSLEGLTLLFGAGNMTQRLTDLSGT